MMPMKKEKVLTDATVNQFSEELFKMKQEIEELKLQKENNNLRHV